MDVTELLLGLSKIMLVKEEPLTDSGTEGLLDKQLPLFIKQAPLPTPMPGERPGHRAGQAREPPEHMQRGCEVTPKRGNSTANVSGQTFASGEDLGMSVPKPHAFYMFFVVFGKGVEAHISVTGTSSWSVLGLLECPCPQRK